MNTTETIVGRMSTANSNYPNVGDTVIAHEIGGAEAWNDEPCVVTSTDRIAQTITGEFKSKQKPDDTLSLSFRVWSPANPVTAADVQPEPDVDALKLAVAALTAEKERLEREVEWSNNRARTYATDFHTVGEALMQEAENRNWCDEYDQFVETVNGQTSLLDLPVREREYEITVTGTAILSWSHNITVTARSVDDAIEMVENDPSTFFDIDEAATDALNYGYGWDSNDVEDVRCD